MTVAAAGSGKTSVMVARAGYAISRGFVPADRVLTLDFEKDAAAELQVRVEDRLLPAGIGSAGLVAAALRSIGLIVIGRATGDKPPLASWLDSGGDVGMVGRSEDERRERSHQFRF